MGINLKDLVQKKEIQIKDLKDKKIVVDSFNVLYQFLTTIRQYDGTPLMDSKGRVTSHLVGLFSRVSKLLEEGVLPIFVFDGVAPELKKAERERRKALKLEAKEKYEKAEREGDTEEMKKYASRQVKLDAEIVEQSKKLLILMGLPVVQAPSEGEAQAAYMVMNGDAYAVASQDYDSLLFGAPRLIQNLTISGKKKNKGKLSYGTVKPEMIELNKFLETLELTREQLVYLAILVGTDFNVGGVKGLGPKKALKLVQKYKNEPEKIFEEAKWGEYFEIGWREIYDIFMKMPVEKEYSLSWNKIDEDKLKEFLYDFDFSEQRIDNTLDRIKKKNSKITDTKQKGINDFF